MWIHCCPGREEGYRNLHLEGLLSQCCMTVFSMLFLSWKSPQYCAPYIGPIVWFAQFICPCSTTILWSLACPSSRSSLFVFAILYWWHKYYHTLDVSLIGKSPPTSPSNQEDSSSSNAASIVIPIILVIILIIVATIAIILGVLYYRIRKYIYAVHIAGHATQC